MSPVWILCIGGLDPSGGAGILADAQTVTELGARPLAVATAWTAQSSLGVAAWEALPTRAVVAQTRALLDDFAVSAVKVGMLSSAETAQALAVLLADKHKIVLDPVLAASVGGALSSPELIAVIRSWLPKITLVTPNMDEAEALVGTRDQKLAAQRLCDLRCRAALVKGSDTAVDVLFGDGVFETIAGQSVLGGPVHGTGCRLASAIATYLGAGVSLPVAVRLAKINLTSKIAQAQKVGSGPLRYF